MSLPAQKFDLKAQAAKNAASSWLNLLSTLVIGFFLAPFILHKLGDDAFGLWILVFSVTGYYGLFDFGIRSSIIKYVAQFTARGEVEELTRFINTSLFVYSCLGAFLLAITGIGSWFALSIFHVSPALGGVGRLVFLMAGTGIALGFPLGVFSGILEGLQQYWWDNFTQIVSNLLRALLIVIALNHGLGLLTITLITVTLPLLGSVALIAIVCSVLPIRIGKEFVNGSTFRRMIRYGSTSFVSMVAGSIRFRSDAVVIGMFLSSAAITFFSVGSKLVDYSRGIVDALAWVFTPMSSHLDAKGDLDGLRKVFVYGNRACALIVFPICATLIILGKSLIEVWVGPKYIATGYSVLVLLLVPQALELAQATSPRILYGMNRHQILSLVRVIEAVANLGLSIALLHFYGVVGVALGTAIPLVCTSLLFLPRHVSRVLDIPLHQFLEQAYLIPLGLCIPLVGTLLFERHVFQPHTYFQLFLQVAVAGLVYAAGLTWYAFTRDPMGMEFRARISLLLRQALNRQ